MLYPTYHQSDKKERYEAAYKRLKENTKFRIFSQEMTGKPVFGFSNYKQLFTAEWYENYNKLYHIAPDGPRTKKLYLGCVKLYRDGQK